MLNTVMLKKTVIFLFVFQTTKDQAKHENETIIFTAIVYSGET
jgi:hypothetical protein